MYEKIKTEIAQDYYRQNFPNDGQRFVAWYVRNVHGLDANQTRYAITDGADDKQIDAIVIDHERATAYVIQGKFIENGFVDAAPLREVLSSWTRIKDLAALQQDGNDKLKERLSALGAALEDEYDLHFELITTAGLTEAAGKDLEQFQKALAEADDLSASLTLVGPDELQRRHELALERDNPYLSHTVTLVPGKYVSMKVADTDVVLAAVPLRACLDFPGIKDGALFQKNVRQSLGLSNAVNKQIKHTIYSDRHKDFFFFHNGITAICHQMHVEGDKLSMKGLSVVNGCQSLTTILSCSEQVKKLQDTYVMFRFYEIPQYDRADKISTATNSQSTVKPRDLRSNDKRVLALKKAFEQRYADGAFLTKRGEQPEPSRNKDRVVDMASLGKQLVAWQSQRPNIAHSETRIFDKYFDQLFKRDYTPERVLALSDWMRAIAAVWTPQNPLGLNDTLLAMKTHAVFHHLFAVSAFFAVGSGQAERVPAPDAALRAARERKIEDWVVRFAGKALTIALTNAAKEAQPAGRVFSPTNWIKAKTGVTAIGNVVQTQFAMLPELGAQAQCEALRLPAEVFEYRWQAD